jgi:hypothetical protein
VGEQQLLVTVDEFVNKLEEREKCSLFKTSTLKKEKKRERCNLVYNAYVELINLMILDNCTKW